MKLLTIALLGCLLMIGIQSPASAFFLSVDDPFLAHSWVQTFNESGVGNFDFMRIDWVSGSHFEVADFRNFTFGSWSPVWDNSTSAGYAGPSLTSVNFDLYFLGQMSTPLSFNFAAYDGGTQVDRALASWSGGGWSFTDAPGYDPGRTPPPDVPEPSVLWLLGAALGGFGLIRWRKTS